MVYLYQAAGKFEVEESGSAAILKLDPTGAESYKILTLCNSVLSNIRAPP